MFLPKKAFKMVFKISSRLTIRLILVIILFFNFFNYSQQEIFVPRNIQQAYDSGTRSLDGQPGRNYWQNYSEYQIDVEIDPSKKLLVGTEDVTYYNNSPDTLKRIIIRLHQNIFKKGSERDFTVSGKAINDGVSINEIRVNGMEIDIENQELFSQSGTIAVLKLQEPMPPKQSIDLFFDWSFIIPSEVRLRMGAYDSTSFFIAYWYPQIAVYDDIDGWDIHPYSGYQEMYNDFSSFEVSITVPNTFAVWATDELQNPNEVFHNEALSRYNEAKSSDSVTNIISKEDLVKGSIFSDAEKKNTWEFKTNGVTDFAFALSDHYLWDGLSVVVDSSTNRRVFVNAAYNEKSEDFYEVADISKKSVQFFSFEMPGVAFPFPVVTVFNGSGGMEFPMMINNGSAKTLVGTVGVTSHEIAHQYFPFYVGTNEKKYAFMDEGWAVMLPFDFQERNTIENYRRLRAINSFQKLAGTETEMSPMTPSIFLTRTPYRTAAYNRPAIAYYFLQDLLGENQFKAALQEFISRWKEKHPTPYDFYYTFNDFTGEDLNWFWKPWFFDKGYPDLAIDKVMQTGDITTITIKRVGMIPIPVKLKLIFEDNSEEEIYYSTNVWKKGNSNFTVDYNSDKIINRVILGGEDIPDSNPDNNLYIIH